MTKKKNEEMQNANQEDNNLTDNQSVENPFTNSNNINESKQDKENLKENASNKENTNQIDKKEVKIAELTETLQRLQADFENYKKRVDKEREQYAKYCNHKFVSSLLPTLDAFEMALKNKQQGGEEKFRSGMEMIFNQFKQALADAGLRPIDCLGKQFDPYKHEALLQEECENSKEDKILQELQKGYMLNDLVLRHSKVKISKKKIV